MRAARKKMDHSCHSKAVNNNVTFLDFVMFVVLSTFLNL